ncbi:hypothetical protein E2C01_077486 [Portunus trituberculatus]|uniref:Uncharacterized protein n=1 Tax=Portunus trituberculatus TaxID=210409 RepID=A0A5B7IG65_PORTR|nr:hypothetical protein [Portunus trituberculatus]
MIPRFLVVTLKMSLVGDMGPNMGTTIKIACATNGRKLNSAPYTLQLYELLPPTPTHKFIHPSTTPTHPPTQTINNTQDPSPYSPSPTPSPLHTGEAGTNEGAAKISCKLFVTWRALPSRSGGLARKMEEEEKEEGEEEEAELKPEKVKKRRGREG